MPEQFDWSVPPLDQADQQLVDAYALVGRPIDDLPYTEDFKRLCASLGISDNDDARHLVFKRLLRLRKMGRLPRLGLLAE